MIFCHGGFFERSVSASFTSFHKFKRGSSLLKSFSQPSSSFLLTGEEFLSVIKLLMNQNHVCKTLLN